MIYYSHANEDTRVERNLMAQRAFGRLYCIAGSGERFIGLLDHPYLEEAVAVDINPDALHVLELKLAALKNLSVADYLRFSGLARETNCDRVAIYHSLRSELSEKGRHYWDGQNYEIQRGLLYTGHFERFLDRIRPLLRRFLGRHFYAYFESDEPILDRFPHLRWKAAKFLFSQPGIYWLAGSRDPAFVARDARTALIPLALQQSLDRRQTDQSFVFHLVFYGDLDRLPAASYPPSLQPGILARIKEALNENRIVISFHHGDWLQYFRRLDQRMNQPAFFSLSDLLTYEDFDYLKGFLDVLRRFSNGPHRAVFRTFTRNALNEAQARWLASISPCFEDHSLEEMTGMYRVYSFDL